MGHRGDFIDLLSVLAPCVMGYGEIGLNLKRDKSSENYAEWMDVYSGEDYQKTCSEMASLIDGAIKARMGDSFASTIRWPDLCSQFRQATILECAFWDMSLR